jgi:hypothetical protein
LIFPEHRKHSFYRPTSSLLASSSIFAASAFSFPAAAKSSAIFFAAFFASFSFCSRAAFSSSIE